MVAVVSATTFLDKSYRHTNDRALQRQKRHDTISNRQRCPAFITSMKKYVNHHNNPLSSLYHRVGVSITTKETKTTTTSLIMAVTPVGPFCPFRSSAANAIESNMEQLSNMGPQFAMDMTKVQLDMSMGIIPDPALLKNVGTKLEIAVEKWMNLLTRFQLSNDFQTREYGKLTQAHLISCNTTVQQISSMVKWQAQCMIAMADQTSPPDPPSDIDLNQLIQQQQELQSSSSSSSSITAPSMTAMAAAEKVTATPFTGKESIFESSSIVKQEYEKLCKDHMYLIEYGSKYTSFDPIGKLVYLDMIDQIHDRWDIFFQRFQLLNILNKEYVQQCNSFLLSMNLNETQYRTLLKDCHKQMRIDAENERKLIYMQ